MVLAVARNDDYRLPFESAPVQVTGDWPSLWFSFFGLRREKDLFVFELGLEFFLLGPGEYFLEPVSAEKSYLHKQSWKEVLNCWFKMYPEMDLF